MIELKNITKAYGDKEHEFYALSHVSCSFKEGKRKAIIGKSGSGTSTRLNLIGALLIEMKTLDLYFSRFI